MSPDRKTIGFLGPECPSVHLVGSDATGRNPDVEERVRISGEIGDTHRLLFSPLSSPEEKKEALKVLRARGVEISPAALAKLGLA